MSASPRYSHGLQCYSCSKEDGNEFCIGTDHISSCSRNQDRCLTQTIYSEERGKLRIDKYCASQAGCEAATAQLGKLYFCDKSRQGWGCLTCCEEDLCNLSKASSSRKPSVLLVAMGLYIVRQMIY
ncbi:ly6/PLAUR domain-containing protein 1-like [Apostichopus japonicus]|uniref:ly6/PLAUR domain-containing protein 1-like n=1 Tax=Stichopus japonicus TaxID=307972 RepID=UPI003AB1F7BA